MQENPIAATVRTVRETNGLETRGAKHRGHLQGARVDGGPWRSDLWGPPCSHYRNQTDQTAFGNHPPPSPSMDQKAFIIQ